MSKPTVALVTPYWYGHHPMYFGEYAAAFMRNGARIIGLCPEPEAGEKEIQAHEATGDFSCHILKKNPTSFFNERFEGDPWHTLQRWYSAADAIQETEITTGHEVDLVFFPHLDAYLRFLPFPRIPESVLGHPWAGLTLRCHHMLDSSRDALSGLRNLAKGDRLMHSESCLGLGVLDERCADPIAKLTGHPVSPFPDVTRNDLPDTLCDQAREIVEKADGRPILGMIGLDQRKGTQTMMKVARLAQEERLPCYFVFAGIFEETLFDEADQIEFRRLRQDIVDGRIDHVHFDPASPRIPSELDYNSVFSTFSIVWCAYQNFRGSSGTLSKAAAFERPVIATEGECIGARVERHQLGINIPEADAGAALKALRQLIESPPQADFEGYRRDHSREKLDQRLGEILSRI